MLVKMKRFEKLANDYAKQFKSWEHQIIARDAYLVAYAQGLRDEDNLFFVEIHEEVEVEFLNGEYQLTDDTRTIK